MAVLYLIFEPVEKKSFPPWVTLITSSEIRVTQADEEHRT